MLVISVLLFVNAGKDNAKRSFAMTSIAITLWISSLGLADTTTNADSALYFVRQAIFIANLIPIFFLAFSLFFGKDFLTHNMIPRLVLISVLPVTLALLSFSDQMVSVVKVEEFGATIQQSGYLYSIHSATSLLFFCAAFGVMLYKRKRTDGVTRNQIQFILAGAGTAYIANLFSGTILSQSSSQGPAILFGTVSIVVFAAVVSFAIIRGRLFDVRLATVRVVTFLLSVGFLAALYGFIAFSVAEQFFFKTIFVTQFSQQLFNTVLAVILAFTFPWIRRFFERATDRVFYRDRYDPQVVISDIGRVLASDIQLESLSKKVVRILEEKMRVGGTNIVVLGYEKEQGDEKEGSGKPQIFFQTYREKKQHAYKIEDISTLRLPVTVADELAASNERDMLERHNIRVALSLRTKEEFTGYLFLGDKRSGDIYSDQDIQTLRIIANELAVAIQNARSYQEIQLFNETLREKIRQATKDLTHANKELKALDKAKDEFISMASHQLRTPLTAVRGYTSMVMDGDFGKVTGEQKDTLKQSFDAATRMTRLVDDLLNVSRIQSGKFRLERAEVDLNKILPEELGLIETTATAKNVKVTYHAPKDPVPLLMIDEGKTRQCLMNLMDNAIYYSSTTPSGGKVDVYLEADKDNVSFRVVDNGIGVPKDQQAKLFKKFYRAPNAQKTRPDGTGLGLFLVGKVVRDQAGKIIFESTEGKGSTFGFSLPIKAAGEGLNPEKDAEAQVATKA
jgi:signal transduction histidine kinase